MGRPGVQGGERPVGVDASPVGLVEECAVETQAGPAPGAFVGATQLGLHAAHLQGRGDGPHRGLVAVVHPARGRQQLGAGVVLQLPPEGQGGLGQADVVRFGVGQAEDPGRAVGAAPDVTGAELLHQSHRPAPAGQPPRRSRAHGARSDHDDVVGLHPVQPAWWSGSRTGKPTAASSAARASSGSTTLIVVIPMARAGLRLTPRSSRNTASSGSMSSSAQARS